MKLAYFLLSSLCISNAFTGEITKLSGDDFKTQVSQQHKIRIINHGLSSLVERLQLIESARKTIDLEYFIFRDDLSSKIVTQALIKKAKEGIQIRVLFDHFMIGSDMTPFIAHEMKMLGIKVKYFNPAPVIRLGKVQYRNHRKSIIIDRNEAIVGGRNIGNEYFDMDPEYNFLDRDIVIQGKIVESIANTFDITFNAGLSKELKRPRMPEKTDSKYQDKGNTISQNDYKKFPEDLRVWKKNVELAKKFLYENIEDNILAELRNFGKDQLDKTVIEGSCQNLFFVSEYPDLGRENIKKGRLVQFDINKRIKKSQNEIIIDSPYFIVNNSLKGALKEALLDGKKISVLTNSLNSTDAPYVYAAFDNEIGKWIDRGLRAYIYKGVKPSNYNIIPSYSSKARFGVHSKTLIFDNKDTYIGTYNIDPRSANFNSELMVACENSPEIANQVKKDIEERMSYSIELKDRKSIKDAEFYEISFKKKITYYLLKLPSILLKQWL